MTAAVSDARARLRSIARRAMREWGLEPEFPVAVRAEVDAMVAAGRPARVQVDDGSLRDLRELPWASIDNDDTRDLDQLQVMLPQDGTEARVLVAVADVDVLVQRGSAT